MLYNSKKEYTLRIRIQDGRVMLVLGSAMIIRLMAKNDE